MSLRPKKNENRKKKNANARLEERRRIRAYSFAQSMSGGIEDIYSEHFKRGGVFYNADKKYDEVGYDLDGTVKDMTIIVTPVKPLTGEQIESLVVRKKIIKRRSRRFRPSIESITPHKVKFRIKKVE